MTRGKWAGPYDVTWWEERPSAKDKLVREHSSGCPPSRGEEAGNVTRSGEAPRSASVDTRWPGAGFPERAV